MFNEDFENGKRIYDSMCEALDKIGWIYQKAEKELVILSIATGDEESVEFMIRIDPVRETITFLSLIPFDVPESKRIEFALAVCHANDGLVVGKFDYDVVDGSILYKFNTFYKFNEIGEDFYLFMIVRGSSVVEEYKPRFTDLAKGRITIQQFMKGD